MSEVVVLGGLGDVYLVASLFAEYQRQVDANATLVVKPNHAAVVELFGLPFRTDDLAFHVEGDRQFQSQENERGSPRFFPHPCMSRTQVDLTPATTLDRRFTQADMFRLIMGLPLDAPMALPRVPEGAPVPGTVIICEAHTWPNLAPEFTGQLATRLWAEGRDVWVNDGKLPLRELLARCARTEWMIGPQCGLMSILIAGRWPCRKTLATPALEGGLAPEYWASRTWPYARPETFSGFSFDVDEFKVFPGVDHVATIELVLNSSNGLRLWPHDPSPTTVVRVPITPGDLLDRVAVLQVKRTRFESRQLAAVEREFQQLWDIAAPFAVSEVPSKYAELVAIHEETFDLLADVVPGVVGGGSFGSDRHAVAVKLNLHRITLKRQIDDALRASWREEKDYYGDVL